MNCTICQTPYYRTIFDGQEILAHDDPTQDGHYPDECDHVDSDPALLCSRCCPCEECADIRAEDAADA